MAAGRGMTIRRARDGDALAVRTLTRAAYAKWVPLIGREPKPMGADYEHAVAHNLIDLFSLDRSPAALIEMKPHEDHLLVVNIAVAPALQGKGLGTRLMVHAEQVARGLGLFELRLYTNQAFVENIVLYRRLGYVIDREETSHLGVTVYMSKTLAGPTQFR